MEETLQVSTHTEKATVFLKKTVKTILLKIPIISVARQYKNAKIVLTPKDKSLEIKATAGPLLDILYGKFFSMEL